MLRRRTRSLRRPGRGPAYHFGLVGGFCSKGASCGPLVWASRAIFHYLNHGSENANLQRRNEIGESPKWGTYNNGVKSIKKCWLFFPQLKPWGQSQIGSLGFGAAFRGFGSGGFQGLPGLLGISFFVCRCVRVCGCNPFERRSAHFGAPMKGLPIGNKPFLGRLERFRVEGKIICYFRIPPVVPFSL